MTFGLRSTPFVPAKAGTQFFLDSRLRGNERSTVARMSASEIRDPRISLRSSGLRVLSHFGKRR
jgi:hypothetical protein